MSTSEFKADPLGAISLGNALRTGFLSLDADLRLTPQIRSGEDHSGCTAIGVLVTPTHFVVGNCGMWIVNVWWQMLVLCVFP